MAFSGFAPVPRSPLRCPTSSESEFTMTEFSSISGVGQKVQDFADALTNLDDLRAALSGPECEALTEKLMHSMSQATLMLDNSMSNNEIDDVLGRGEGPLHAISQRVAESYGAVRAVLSTHGSSQVNLAMGMALRATFGPNPRILADRGCHLSVSSGLAFAHIKDVVWLDQTYVEACGVRRPVGPDELDRLLMEDGPFDAVMLTIPSYDGFLIEDAAELRRVCDRHGCFLIADAAWSAFQGLLQDSGFPPSIAAHAHATTISLHKKGLSCSGTSVALFNNEDLAQAYMRFCDMGLISTSPFFVLFAVLEQVLDAWQSTEGKALARRMVSEARRFAEELDSIPGVQLIRPQDLGPGLIADPSHVLIDVRGTGLRGYDIMEALSDRYAHDPEKATLTSLLFLFGPAHLDIWPNIVEAVREIVRLTEGNPRAPEIPAPPATPGAAAMPMHVALFAKTEQVPPDQAVGRIAAQPVAAYPPGAAILQPGEWITFEAVQYLISMQHAGSRLRGVAGPIEEIGLTVLASNATEIEE